MTGMQIHFDNFDIFQFHHFPLQSVMTLHEMVGKWFPSKQSFVLAAAAIIFLVLLSFLKIRQSSLKVTSSVIVHGFFLLTCIDVYVQHEQGSVLIFDDRSLAQVQNEVQQSMNRADQNEKETRSLMAAVSGSSLVHNSVAKRKLSTRKPRSKPGQIHRSIDVKSSDESEIEDEAREAGARSLYERDPLNHPLPITSTSRLHARKSSRSRQHYHTTSELSSATADKGDVTASNSTAGSSPANPKLNVISNPRGYLRNDDRYVPSGANLDRDAFLQKYLNPQEDKNSTDNTTESGHDASAAPEKRARQQELASIEWPTMSVPAKPAKSAREWAAAARLQSLNSPEAPTLSGGIPVPGGHVIWVPENSLAPAEPAEGESSAASGSAQSRVASAAKSIRAGIARPTTAGPAELVLPLPVTDYSKVVAYGPDGHRELIWYRPSPASDSVAPAAAAASPSPSLVNYPSTHLRPGPHEQYSVVTTGTSAGARRRLSRGRGLSAQDRRIERDLLLRLMAAPEQGTVRPPRSDSTRGRPQQLAQVSAAATATGRVGLRRALVALSAAVVALWGAGRLLG